MRIAAASFLVLLAPGVLGSCAPSAPSSGGAGTTGSAGATGSASAVGSAGTGGGGGGRGGTGGSGPSCPANRMLCGTECVDTSGDPRHCGGCGQACGANQVCASSGCQAAADCRQTPCAGLSYCDLATGQCKPGCALDAQCTADETCDIATHACVCKTGFNRCGGTCVADNSGLLACGSVCATCPTTGATAFACSGTACVATACVSGYHVCDGSCVSNSSVDSCGTSCTPCSIPTNGAATCNGTTCGITCNAGTLSCGGVCATCPPGATATACSGTSCVANACGSGFLACGGACAACPTTGATAFACSGSSCVASACAASGYRLCGGACTTCPTTNVNTTTCSGTTCVVSTCISGYHVCAGTCVSNSNLATCGSSCTPCPAVANGTATCTGTACSATCTTGYRLCGAVCALCPTGNVSTTTCSGSTCVVSACASGYHLCSSGCVSNSSVASCGTNTCTACPAPAANGAATCNGTSCGITCNTGWTRCGASDCCADCRQMSGVCTGLDWCSDINGLCAPVQKLQPDATGTANDYFGYRVALSGSLAVIGAERDDNSAGSVFTFERQTDGKWVMQGSRLQPSTTANTWFGTGLAMLGQRLVVGARGDGIANGAAYIFERVGGQWVQQAKLTGEFSGAYFGAAVALDGDRLIVGAALNTPNPNSTNHGAAYIFERQSDGTWPTTGIKLVASNAITNSRFGTSVTISGDKAAIGSMDRAVYIFVRQSDGTWIEQQILRSTGVSTSDGFGTVLSLRGDRLVAGAPGDTDRGAYGGAAYVIELGTSTSTNTTTKVFALPANAGVNDQFGASVSQEGDRILVGAPGENPPGGTSGTLGYSGAAYFVERAATGWITVAMIGSHPDDFMANRYLGADVAISGDFVLMGAWGDLAGPPIAGRRTGTAYVANWRSVLP